MNSTPAPWSQQEFEDKLRSRSSSYHIHHPFHVMMAEGKLSREQLQGWVANRFYYQISIPVKDAAILSNCPDREIRREWIQRILDAKRTLDRQAIARLDAQAQRTNRLDRRNADLHAHARSSEGVGARRGERSRARGPEQQQQRSSKLRR